MDITKNNISNIPDTKSSGIFNVLSNPIPLFILLAIMFIYIVFFYSIKSNTTSIQSSSMTSFVEILLGILFIR